ncbi:MAG: hypothetical protein HYZ71_00525 [Deltaproteobacteria bacterium]|nr:hypothetical protein [Deltaproteobacteria bacterium]
MEKPPQNRWTVLDHLLEANLNHINMSVAHFDRETNAAVMRMKPHDHDSLERAIEQAVKRGVRPRFSLVLLKEGIHDLKGLKDYLDWARNLGVDDIWIRELSAYDPTTTVFDHTAEYIDRERVKIDSILNEIDQDPDFRLVLQKSTTNSYRESYRFREVDIGFTDYRVIPPLVSLSGQPAPGNSSDKVKVFVLHPNGSLNAAWQEWERIIIPAPKPQ